MHYKKTGASRTEIFVTEKSNSVGDDFHSLEISIGDNEEAINILLVKIIPSMMLKF